VTRAASDATLQSNIDTNATAIQAETARAIAAETGLQDNIDAESVTRAAADATLQSNIDTNATAIHDETVRATTAEAGLQANLADEAATRAAGDIGLQDNINVEASTRSAADIALQENINTNTADIADNSMAINQEVADRSALIRKEADGSIHIGPSSLISNQVDGEEELYARDGSDNAININVTNGSDLLVNGISVATDSDVAAAMSSQINIENKLQTNINNETSERIAADQSMGNRIDDNSRRIDQNTRGIAMVAAMTNTTIQPGMTQAVDFNVAHFEGETGFAFGYAHKINEHIQLNAAASSTADFEESVVRLGLSYQW
jgi:hypothetical protein